MARPVLIPLSIPAKIVCSLSICCWDWLETSRVMAFCFDRLSDTRVDSFPCWEVCVSASLPSISMLDVGGRPVFGLTGKEVSKLHTIRHVLPFSVFCVVTCEEIVPDVLCSMRSRCSEDMSVCALSILLFAERQAHRFPIMRRKAK